MLFTGYVYDDRNFKWEEAYEDWYSCQGQWLEEEHLPESREDRIQTAWQFRYTQAVGAVVRRFSDCVRRLEKCPTLFAAEIRALVFESRYFESLLKVEVDENPF